MIYEKWLKAWNEADIATYRSLHHEDWEFKFHSSGNVMRSGDMSDEQMKGMMKSNKNENLSLKVPIRNSNVSKENYEEYYKMGKASIHDNNIFDEYEKFKINSKKIDDLKFDN